MSYYEKLIADGYRPRGYFHRIDIADAIDNDVRKGMEKIVLVPAYLVPEAIENPSIHKDKCLRVKNEYYVRFGKYLRD